MKQKLLLAIFGCCVVMQWLHAQNSYIYIHQKTLNEQASVDFSYKLTNSSGATVATFSLNNNPAVIQTGDIGAGHGTTTSGNGDGQLWAIASTSVAYYNVSPVGLTGAIYMRPSASSQWAATAVTSGALAVDGAYFNECVYVNSSGNVYFYYLNPTTGTGTSTQIYSGGNATDVAVGGGNIAIVAGGAIEVYNKQYVAGASIITTNGAWTTVTGISSSTASRIDMNVGGTSIAWSYVNGTTETIYTKGITVTGGTGTPAGTVALGSTATANTFTTSTDTYGNTVGGAGGAPDVCYDDKGYLYAIASSTTYNGSDAVYSNTSGSWVIEPQSRLVQRMTGSAGGQVWGVIGYGTENTIWARNTDGTHIWIDDERVRTSGVGTAYKTGGGTGSANTNTGVGVANGNAIMIPVTNGTYTLTETLPDATWDLGRYTTYVPSTSSITTNVSTQQVTITVAAGDVVHVEYFNEKLSPKAIALTCTTSVLEDFGTDGTGTITFGDTVQGTAYHYFPQGNGTPTGTTSPQDGDYFVVKDLTHWFINPTPALQSHTNPGTGFFLVVNASYALDEFYRKRVTNLSPGVQYTISFYAANVNYTGFSTPATQDVRIPPNVSYGLQDVNGNIVNSSTTGSIDTTGPTAWVGFSFTFTATTSQADFFLRNNTIGGLGNDIALDDISINPVITPLPAITVSPNIAPYICIGSTYTFSLTGLTSGSPLTTGTWSANPTGVIAINGSTGKARGLTPGDAVITYRYTNAIGCVSTQTTSAISTSPPIITAAFDLLGGTICLGQTDSLYSTVSGGTAPFKYAWSETDALGTGGLSTATIQNTAATPTAAGSYTFGITVTDNVGCTGTSSVSITELSKPAPTVTATSVGPYCSGSSFALQSTGSGGNGPLSYTWSSTTSGNGLGVTNTQNTTATPTAAGSYLYTVKVNDGYCNALASKTVTYNQTPTVAVTPATGSSISLCLGGTIALGSTPSSGTAPYTYTWSASGLGNGLSSTTNTQNTSAQPTLSNTSPGDTYSVLVKDANGCTVTGSTTLKVTEGTGLGPTVSVTSPTTQSICSGTQINLTATVTGGVNNTFLWSGPTTITSATSQNTTATPTSSGTYTLTVTSSLGLGLGTCTTSANSGYVTVNPSPAVTASSYAADLCSGTTATVDSVYAAASGGTSPYTYAWTVSPTGGMSVSLPTSDTSAVTGGTSGTTYTFSVKVTDNSSTACTATATTTIAKISNSGPAISGMNAAATICNGSTITLNPTVTKGSTGGGSYTKLTPAATGGNNVASCSNYSYAFDGSTSTIFADYSAGNPNTGWVYADLGAAYQITQITFTPVTGGASYMTGGVFYGTTTAPTNNFVGATTLYTISSTPSSGLNTVTSIASTTAFRYIVYQGPSSSGSYNLGGSCNYSGNYYSLVADIGLYTGSGSTSVGIASYGWSGAPSGNGLSTTTNTQSTTATPTTAGAYVYTLKVVDNAGCAVSASTGTQTVGTAVTATMVPSKPNFCGGADSVILTIFTSGGSGTYSSYAWTAAVTTSPGTTTLDASTTTTGSNVANVSGASTSSKFTYGVTVTDSKGCSSTASTDLLGVGTTPTLSTPTATIGNPCTGQTFTLNATSFSSGTSPFNYSWTGSTGATITTSSGTVTSTPVPATTAATSSQGNYTFGLLLIDANNCVASASTVVTAIDTVPTVSLSAGSATGCAGTASVNLIGTLTYATVGTYQYAWTGSGVVNNTSSITTTAAPTTSGTYGLTVTDGNGCTGSATSGTVTVNPNPVITLSSNKSVACAMPATTVTLTAPFTTATTAPYSYAWTGSAGTAAGIVTTPTSSNSTTAVPTAAGTYSVTVTDANGCSGSATSANVAYDNPVPIVSATCNSSQSSIQLSESSGVATLWLWTTTSGGRFYTSSAYSVNSDSSTSHLQAPFIKQDGLYTVTITDANSCTDTASINYTSTQCGTILAITLANFTAQKQGNGVLLDWTTINETNNQYFDVERSSDGINWQVIGRVQGHGNATVVNNYTFTDALPVNGVNYYKLKDVDVNGDASYSPVRSVLFTGVWVVKMYPNPAQSYLVLEFNNEKDEKAEIVIQDALGRAIFKTEQQLVKGFNNITLNQINPLAQGTYIITMGTTENVYRSRFVKAGN